MEVTSLDIFSRTAWQDPDRPLVPGLDLKGSAWKKQALCRSGNPDRFYVRGPLQVKVKQGCRNCPVRRLCLDEAIKKNIEYGIWGGLTGYERRKLLEGKPTNWTRVLYPEGL